MIPVKSEANVPIDICCHVGRQNEGGVAERTREGKW